MTKIQQLSSGTTDHQRIRAQFLKLAPYLTIEEADILAWRDEGYNHAWIAQTLGCCLATVYNIITKIQKKQRKSLWTILFHRNAKNGGFVESQPGCKSGVARPFRSPGGILGGWFRLVFWHYKTNRLHKYLLHVSYTHFNCCNPKKYFDLVIPDCKVMCAGNKVMCAEGRIMCVKCRILLNKKPRLAGVWVKESGDF